MRLCMMPVNIFVSCLGITELPFNKIISFENLYHFVPLLKFYQNYSISLEKKYIYNTVPAK
jgi:hypothetical protein